MDTVKLAELRDWLLAPDKRGFAANVIGQSARGLALWPMTLAEFAARPNIVTAAWTAVAPYRFGSGSPNTTYSRKVYWKFAVKFCRWYQLYFRRVDRSINQSASGLFGDS